MDQNEKDTQKAIEKWTQAVSVAELPEMSFPMSQQQADAFGVFDEDAVSETEAKTAQFDNDIDINVNVEKDEQ